MARGKAINPEALAKLGPERLAGLVVEACENDQVLRRKVTILLASEAGPDKVKSAIAKRISSLARARSFVDWRGVAKLAGELEALREGLVTRLAPEDPDAALDLMWRFLEIAEHTFERVDDSSGRIGDVFHNAADDLGSLFAKVRGCDGPALAERLHAGLGDDDYGVFSRTITSGADGLGPEGRARLRALLEADMARLPARQDGEAWNAVGWPRARIASQLAELADAESDVDAYMDAVRLGEREHLDAAAVAKRLIMAGRADEALDWLDKDQRARSPFDLDVTDLRIAALEALDRPAEAQTLRWQAFEMTLSASHLREHLKRLPDFEDFDAEQRAIAHAATFADALTALNFLVRWPALETGDALVRRRIAELDGRHYDWLSEAADRLSDKWPVSATLLYRAMVISVLQRAASKAYPHAARNLELALFVGERLTTDSGIPDNAAFLATLKSKHGRKYSFWSRVPDL